MKTADYLAALERHAQEAYAVAKAARTRGLDPAPQPEVFVARNMAERVIGLLSVVAPQLVGKGAEARIFELEAQYGVLDWRVALKLSEDIARERFCAFHDRREAMEVGIRAGFTYITLGVVSSPLEGFTGLEIKRRRDGKEYFCLNYSGPIRNAGGTAASVSVLIGDYIRARFGYAPYDPDERERKRTFIELGDYHEQVTNLQYVPSEAEVDFLMAHLPVEISGDPSEKHEVSNVNYKDLERVPTNRLRSGFCLIHSSCIPLKAPKLWKALKAWGAQFGLGHWGFLEAFLAIQKTAKAKGKASSSAAAKLAPDYTYIHDLVAGRPVLAHPLRSGGFRLRYGRSRVSGFSAQAIHPATMHVLNGFVATATQLKVERPGKAAAYAPCDTIDGPIVKLHDGSVLALASEKEALAVKSQVAEILYLGDVLVNYGDFYNRAHPLVPAGYCPEFWAQELKAALEGAPEKRPAPRRPRSAGIPEDRILALQSDPLRTPPTFEEAVALSRNLSIPLHPAYTYFWSSLEAAQLADLIAWLRTAAFEDGKLILGLPGAKRALEVLGVPHRAVLGEHVVIEGPHSAALLFALGATAPEDLAPANGSPDAALAAVSARCPVPLRDKAGVFIGARMGRPEKAKMRRLVGSPHVLFPVGTEGGRLRCFQSALERGRVTANFPLYRCNPCRTQTIYAVCERCRGRTTPLRSCPSCGTIEGCPHESLPYSRQALDIKHYFEAALRELGTEIYPDLIKGVKGTSNQDHVPEYLPKGILRAKHNIAVNKDGTTRVDCSEVTLTHFKPKEVHVDVATLRRLGYATDIHGKALESEDQILELKVQDIVLPCCRTSPDEPADEVLFRVSKFVDELLLTVYGLPAHYNLRGPKDLVGAHVIGLAPHTSAGILGRIIGFSSTQAFLAHPLFHAAMRRDCDGDESCILLLMDALLNFSRRYLPNSRGSTMDAPLVLTTVLNPAEVDDMAFDLDIAWEYPLEFYLASLDFKMPWEVKVPQLKHVLGSPGQYEGMGFTHDTDDFNAGVTCSAYKTLPSMEDKLKGQMDLAVKIRAVDERDVASLVIEKHFLRDTKGNLRKFSQQQFRCVDCNEKYRRPPLIGRCACGGKLLFTITEGSVVKYLEPSISLAERFDVSPYLKQTLELTRRRIEDYFGKDPEKQLGLGKWF